MALKLVENLFRLGIDSPGLALDANAISEAMARRPKRSYGGPPTSSPASKPLQVESGLTSSGESTDSHDSKSPTVADSTSSFGEDSPKLSHMESPTKTTSNLVERASLLGLDVQSPVAASDTAHQLENQHDGQSSTTTTPTIAVKAAPEGVSMQPNTGVHTNGDTAGTGQHLQADDTQSSNLTGSPASIRQWFFGQPAPVGMKFCPVLAVQKLPYKIMHNDTVVGPKIDQQFINEGKFWRRDWTLFYIWHSTEGEKPLIVVPAHEVELFFNDINASIRAANLSVRRLGSSHTGFCIEFASQHARLRPRFLGFVSSQDQYRRLQDNSPGSHFLMAGEEEGPSLTQEDGDVQKYDILISLARDLSSNKSKKKNRSARGVTPQARQQQIMTINRDWESDLKQVQRFLGLRPVKPGVDLSTAGQDAENGQSWAEESAQWAAEAEASRPAPIDESKPAPFPRDSDVIFICVDVEAYEHDNKKITEIGICMLDTRDLLGVAPGEYAKNWYRTIHAKHFRIQDHSHLRNGDFVVDHAGQFKFGTSEWIKLEEAPKNVASLFRPPMASGASRTLVLVGHDVNADIRFLRGMGYDVSNLSTLHRGFPKIDTQNLYRAVQQEKDHSRRANSADPVKLSVIMDELDILPWGLHNAGNDAVYTLQVMLGMAVESAKNREAPASQQDWNESAYVVATQLSKAAQEKKENDGWDSDGDLPEWKRKHTADDDWRGHEDDEW